MRVKRIVTNIEAQDITAAKRFYEDVLGLELWMDHGWIRTYGSSEEMSIQISFATQGDLTRLCLICRLKSMISKLHLMA